MPRLSPRLAGRGLSLRAALDAALGEGKLRPRPVIEANSLRVMSSLARAGHLIAFQPRVGIEQHLKTGALVFVPLSDPTLPLDRLMLVRQRGRTVTPAAEAFFEHVIMVLAGAHAGIAAPYSMPFCVHNGLFFVLFSSTCAL
jgi:DNA-binding transcriptional LysR family regulator